MDMYDRAMKRLDADLENNLISDKEYEDEMRELHAEMRQQAEAANGGEPGQQVAQALTRAGCAKRWRNTR